jgi:hypothetical protein
LLKTRNKPYTTALGFIEKNRAKKKNKARKRHRALAIFVFLPKHKPTLKKQKILIFAKAQYR